MSVNIKVSAVAASVPYDNSVSLVSSTNVQQALDVLFAVPASIPFSYKLIQSTESVTIPIRMEMVVNNYIEVDGILIIEGDLSIV